MEELRVEQGVRSSEVEITGNALRPFISMWVKPRETVQQIVDTETDSEMALWLLAGLAGFANALGRAVSRNLGDHMSLVAIIGLAALTGPVIGILAMYIESLLIQWTGRWIGGRGSANTIRIAIAWSQVPVIWALLLWIPKLAVFGSELFTTETPRLDSSFLLSAALVGVSTVATLAWLWHMVIFLKSLGQVQGFSAWKALINVVLAVLVLAIPLAVVSGLVAILLISKAT